MLLKISPSLLKKSCPHDEKKYYNEGFEEISEKDGIIEIYKGIRSICSECGAKWDRARSRKYTYKSKNVVPIQTLTSEEKKVFRSIFNTLIRKDKVSKNLILQKIRNVNLNYEQFIRKFFQKGFFEKIRIPSYSTTPDNIYFRINNSAKEFLKKELNILLPIEQLKFLENTLQSIKYNLITPKNEFHCKLIKFLDNINQNLNNEKVFFNYSSDKKITPHLSASKDPIFLKILHTYIIWCKIYRNGMTLRELSSRAFTIFPIKLGKDPSKVISAGTIKEKFQQFIKYNLGFNIEDAGLFPNYETVDFSGQLNIQLQNSKSTTIKNSIFSLSNLFIHQIKAIEVPSKKILLVENLAVLSQIGIDNWAIDNNILVIYIAGKSSRFIQQVLRIINESNKNLEVFIWIDYDLGGIQIFEFLCSVLPDIEIKVIEYPENFNIPIIEFNDEKRAEIEKYCDKELQIKKFAQFLLKNGKIEQEYLLEWYNEILNYNFQRIK